MKNNRKISLLIVALIGLSLAACSPAPQSTCPNQGSGVVGTGITQDCPTSTLAAQAP